MEGLVCTVFVSIGKFDDDVTVSVYTDKELDSFEESGNNLLNDGVRLGITIWRGGNDIVRETLSLKINCNTVLRRLSESSTEFMFLITDVCVTLIKIIKYILNFALYYTDCLFCEFYNIIYILLMIIYNDYL